jgi:hypothetical protein
MMRENRLSRPLNLPALRKVPPDPLPRIPVVVVGSGMRKLILNDYG